jgi:hypothetical protein
MFEWMRGEVRQHFKVVQQNSRIETVAEVAQSEMVRASSQCEFGVCSRHGLNTIRRRTEFEGIVPGKRRNRGRKAGKTVLKILAKCVSVGGQSVPLAESGIEQRMPVPACGALRQILSNVRSGTGIWREKVSHD